MRWARSVGSRLRWRLAHCWAALTAGSEEIAVTRAYRLWLLRRELERIARRHRIR